MKKITFLCRITLCFSLLTTSLIYSQYDATNAQVGDELTVNGMLSTTAIDPEEGVNGNGECMCLNNGALLDRPSGGVPSTVRLKIEQR